MNTEHASPGDTIEITHHRYFTGKQFVVIERPSTALLPHKPGEAWIMRPDGPGFWKPEHYKIVKRKGEIVSTSSIRIDTPVDLEQSARRKRDEIMRGWFT